MTYKKNSTLDPDLITSPLYIFHLGPIEIILLHARCIVGDRFCGIIWGFLCVFEKLCTSSNKDNNNKFPISQMWEKKNHPANPPVRDGFFLASRNNPVKACEKKLRGWISRNPSQPVRENFARCLRENWIQVIEFRMHPPNHIRVENFRTPPKQEEVLGSQSQDLVVVATWIINF